MKHDLQKQWKIKHGVMMTSLEHEDDIFRLEAQFF